MFGQCPGWVPRGPSPCRPSLPRTSEPIWEAGWVSQAARPIALCSSLPWAVTLRPQHPRQNGGTLQG